MKYYIQDKRQYVGNCMLFWRENGAGYTTDISEAGLFSEERSLRIVHGRDTDVRWRKEVIEASAKPRVDFQDVE